MELGVNSWVSRASDGGFSDGHFPIYPSISTDGNFVTFRSDATNLVTGDANGKDHVFLWHRECEATTRVSLNPDGEQGDHWNSYPSLGRSGDVLVFSSGSSNLQDVPTDPGGDVYVVIDGINNPPMISRLDGDSDEEALRAGSGSLSVSRTLSVEDVNVDDTVVASVETVEVSGVSDGIGNSTFLDMLTVGENPVIDGSTTTGKIEWTFESGDETFDFLGDGEFVELTFTIKATDSREYCDRHTVTIRIDRVSNQAPEISVEYGDSDSGASTAGDTGVVLGGSLSVSDQDLPDVVVASIESVVVSGNSNGIDELVSWKCSM